MKRTFFLLCCLLFVSLLRAQPVLGRITDARSGGPVAGAIIYADGSQLRFLSDSAGCFRTGTLPRGSKLHITHLSYERGLVEIRGTDTLRVVLQPREQELASVTIQTKARDTRKKWGAVFTEYFIGSGEAAKQCRLLNPEVLVFNYNEAAHLLLVRARAPLRLENRLLGYRLHIDLEYFRFSFDNGTFVYSGSSYYEPMAAENEREALRFAAQRLLAYGGSRQHFVRALYEGRLRAEGFHLYGFRARPNDERARVEALLLRERARQNSQARSSVNDNALLLSGVSADSARYYARLLGQPGYIFEDSLPLNLGARWTAAPTGTAFRIPDSLLLQYTPAATVRDAARRLGRWSRWATPGNEAYTFLQSPDASSRYALLYLQNDSLLRGNADGVVYNNSALYTEGYLSQRRTAFALPLDYQPAADEALLDGRKVEPDSDEQRAVRLDSLLAGMNRRSDVSRIYLHLDKTHYDPFEHIWFSAYLLHSPVPPAAHRTLEVLLLQKEGKRIRARERFVLREGRGAGCLFLPDSLPAGRYELIAYTDQQATEPGMPLFRQEILLRGAPGGFEQRSIAGDNEIRHDSVFLVTRIYTDKKAYAEGLRVHFRLTAGPDLLVEGNGQVASGGFLRLPGLPLAHVKDRQLALHTEILDKARTGPLYTELRLPATPVLRWYPEGGDLVDSLPARLVFECRDAFGLPVAQKAVLYENETPLAALETSGDGFGSIVLRPRRDRRYSVRSQTGTPLETAPFPPVRNSGLTLQVDQGVVRDSVDVRLFARAPMPAYLLLHDFRTAYARLRIQAGPAGTFLRIPLGTLPSGPATLTVFDSSDAPLAERTLLREDTQAVTLRVSTDSARYGNRHQVQLRISARDEQGHPLATDISIACVKTSNVASDRYRHIVPFARWQRYAALQQWPLQPPGYSLESKEANERFLLTQCWTRFRWTGLVTSEIDSTQPAQLNWQGQVTYQGYPLRKAVDVLVQGSDSLHRVRTDNKGYFTLSPEAVTAQADWLIQAFVDMPDKHLYHISFRFGSEARQSALAAQPSPGYRQNGVIVPELTENQRYKTLATVVKKIQRRNSPNGQDLTPNNMGGCPDFVCSYGILNCANHPEGSRKPVLQYKYWMRDVGLWYKLVTYRGCGKYDENVKPDPNPVLYSFPGRYYSKEFYVSDYRKFNPAVPETATTLYWNPQVTTDDKGEATVNFYSNDLEGAFQVIVEGMSGRGPVQGGSSFRVEQRQPPGQ